MQNQSVGFELCRLNRKYCLRGRVPHLSNSCALQMVNIREFELLDQPGINKLQEDFMIDFFPEYANDPRQYAWNADTYDINECYTKNGGKVLVAVDGNYIAGFGGFRLVNAKTAEIRRVRIDSRYRGKGLGKAIIEQIESYCRENDIVRILVDTDNRFEAAKSMYANMGYVMYRTEIEAENGIEYTDNFYDKYI